MNFKDRLLDAIKQMPFIEDGVDFKDKIDDFYHADNIERAGILLPAISIPLITLGIGYGVYSYKKRLGKKKTLGKKKIIRKK